MKIGIASDHRGYNKKQKIKKYLVKKGYEVIDYGTDSNKNVDYPDFAIKIGEAYNNKEFMYGITICSNGVGMSIACNKVKGIRCAKINNQKEVVSAKREDNINMIALPASLFMFEIKDIISSFFKTSFSDKERYSRRIKKLDNYEASK